MSLGKTAADISAAHPHVDILVNNLGIFEPVSFEDIPDDDWRRLFEVNVLSGVRLARQYLSLVKDRNCIQRFASSDEVAALVSYLACPLVSATTDAALHADGGVIKSAYYALTVEDLRFDNGEERFITFGILEGRVVAVVHTERVTI